ncbi:hypothetical protein [Lachnotalea glycerini]|uniref:NTP pyrophosphohydrolase MazG putative catalytic core domain-containing protein n=1 Tax=Lachnotalea glycerini TaxID=1763509 RepID=A0A371JH08_9FIRM|nr:hypothetical protein [Lachnotalea glycerini]RDY32015.1 hypothetical protein CG710_006865 [Lachnotalea glycerini]
MKEMIERMQEIHDKFKFKENGGEDILFRLSLMMEELGEICSAVTKNKGDIAEEHADLLILLLGNCISLDIDIESEYWKKTDEMLNYKCFSNGKNIRLVSKENE